MTVVGHVEQMHLSRCWQASKTLTCLTCHNPHDEPGPERRDRHYNAVCQDCHPPERCRVSKAQREKESPENSCIHCHMPTSPTELQHLAFTHHRIGIHNRATPENDRAASAPHPPAVLRSFFDQSRWSEVERQRTLGLAYYQVADEEKEAGPKAQYSRWALERMEGTQSAGLRDSLLDASVGWLRFGMGLDGVVPPVERALQDPNLAAQERCQSLFLVSAGQMSQGRHEAAAETLRRLTGLRRHPVDWLMLGDCEARLGHQDAAVAAQETAVRINPRDWRSHQRLAEHYRRQGDARRAAWHEQRAVP
jgi:hypothetical protein